MLTKINLLTTHFNLEGKFGAELLAADGNGGAARNFGPYTIARAGISIFHGGGGGNGWAGGGTINSVTFNGVSVGVSGRNCYSIRECKIGDKWTVNCVGRQSDMGDPNTAYFAIFVAYMK